MQRSYTFCLLIFACIFSGCSRVPPADDCFVSCNVADRIDSQADWRQGCCQDEETQAFIACMVANELSADAAIQIALLNNPKIQAIFEELGIARADLLEAGLLSNPSFEIEVRYPHVKGLHTNIEYLITSGLLDIFLIPLRTRLAAAEFDQTKLRVSHEILDLAFDVRETFYELVAEREKLKYLQSVVALTRIVSDIVTKQAEIGNVNPLELQKAQSRNLEVELEFLQSQTRIIRLREKFNRQLGFAADICLKVPESLPQDTDYRGFDLCALETIALEERLDLQVARFEITRLGRMLGLKDWWTYTNLKGGLAGEREPDGPNLIGPGFSGEIPIFNYGQAARMRLYAQLRQAQDHLSELEIRVLSEVREAHGLLMSYLKIVDDYRNRLLPLQGRILATSEELYNVMGLGVDKLLENKRLAVEAYLKYTESTKEYLLARVELDRALGGYLFRLLAQRECFCGELE